MKWICPETGLKLLKDMGVKIKIIDIYNLRRESNSIADWARKIGVDEHYIKMGKEYPDTLHKEIENISKIINLHNSYQYTPQTNDYLKIELTNFAINEYIDWLAEWLAQGNKPTYWYDYPIKRCEFEYLGCNWNIKPLYGAKSKSVILRYGCKISQGIELGHNKVFGRNKTGPWTQDWIPLYQDIVNEVVAKANANKG